GSGQVRLLVPPEPQFTKTVSVAPRQWAKTLPDAMTQESKRALTIATAKFRGSGDNWRSLRDFASGSLSLRTSGLPSLSDSPFSGTEILLFVSFSIVISLSFVVLDQNSIFCWIHLTMTYAR